LHSHGRMFKNNGLSIVLLSLFLLTLGGQAVTGWGVHNADEQAHGRPAVTFGEYLGTGHFWEATGENWESEFLQMAMFVLLTAFLYQKGSAESKRIGVTEEQDMDPRDFSDQPDVPGPVKRGGWQLRLYENSLGIAFLTLFVISFLMHAGGGLVEYNKDQVAHGESAVTLIEYVGTERFWFESFQNWQSEFLSLAAMVIGTIFLRQRGSAESKAVHAPHAETGRA
jgi:hypothetical protein